jgi:hypothetical protein
MTYRLVEAHDSSSRYIEDLDEDPILIAARFSGEKFGGATHNKETLTRCAMAPDIGLPASVLDHSCCDYLSSATVQLIGSTFDTTSQAYHTTGLCIDFFQ